ncbi:FecCD family ABC transporter permease [Propionicicella superfundia]|uniref:FecCD family ABC transporter permease n=1 Tax=Propionicicella superfundia TaxID=348582 RepID=UPI000400BBA1|nr:iron chelate uptake ABC transporter family permease subunit [Propionicicella superfundia]
MSLPKASRTDLETPVRSASVGTARRRGIGLAVAVAVVATGVAVSLAVGSNPIPPARVWEVLVSPDGSFEAIVVQQHRLPRTLLLLVVGAALGVAGALMQSLTRNPLADPGLLGINAGASLAVVTAVAAAGAVGIAVYLWFAFAGAALAAIAVYLLGGSARTSPTPERLALAGVAISMTISSLVQTVILADQNAFNEFRYWVAGSVEGRGFDILLTVCWFIAAGLMLALALAPALNALALGETTGRALGVNVRRTRALAVVAITLLAGAATAAAGPIMFIGLGVPYLARSVCGPDQRWVLPFTMISAPAVVLAADVVARIVLAPAEVPVGVLAALMGGPVFVLIVRRRRIEAL